MNIMDTRVWNKKEKTMKKVNVLDFLNKEVTTNNGETLKFEDVELMANTYAKDKNGIYIFGGDILRVETECRNDRVVVEYNSERLGFKCRVLNRQPLTFLTFDFDRCEIIGNCFENKELL